MVLSPSKLSVMSRFLQQAVLWQPWARQYRNYCRCSGIRHSLPTIFQSCVMLASQGWIRSAVKPLYAAFNENAFTVLREVLLLHFNIRQFYVTIAADTFCQSHGNHSCHSSTITRHFSVPNIRILRASYTLTCSSVCITCLAASPGPSSSCSSFSKFHNSQICIIFLAFPTHHSHKQKCNFHALPIYYYQANRWEASLKIEIAIVWISVSLLPFFSTFKWSKPQSLSLPGAGIMSQSWLVCLD